MTALGIGSGIQVGSMGQPGQSEVGNKMIAEKMVNQNLKDNVSDLQQELNKICSQVKEMVGSCDQKLEEVVRQAEELKQPNPDNNI